MKNTTLLNSIFILLMITFFSNCKEDCVFPVQIIQTYKLYYPWWYPYKENDTLNFLRLPENDTLIFYGGRYSFPTYERSPGCDCCPIPKYEFLQQTFYTEDKKNNIRVEMDGGSFEFIVNNVRDYGFDIGGHGSQLSEVTTPDSVYTWAYKEDDAGHSCYYAGKVGIVKYAYENNGVWLFLRKK